MISSYISKKLNYKLIITGDANGKLGELSGDTNNSQKDKEVSHQ